MIDCWHSATGNEADEDKENNQDLNAERDTFSGHSKHFLSFENRDSVFLAAVVVFMGVCVENENQDADDERDDDEKGPSQKREPVIERPDLQKRQQEQHKNDIRHENTSFLG